MRIADEYSLSEIEQSELREDQVEKMRELCNALAATAFTLRTRLECNSFTFVGGLVQHIDCLADRLVEISSEIED